MIISHKYKYVFIQLDKTASTAIAKELEKNYAGRPILWKHARYEDFMRIAKPEEKKYFIFSGIRNPLDTVVSYYYFHKLNPGNRGKTNFKMHFFIKNHNAEFPEYFKKFISKNIHQEWKTKNFSKLDFIYRYENIQEDFSKILKILKIGQKNPIPVFNKTAEKQDYINYYPEEIQGMAKIVFSDYMNRWKYDFSENWREPSFKEKKFIKPLLCAKLLFQKIFHSIVDQPIIYKNYYKIKNITSNG